MQDRYRELSFRLARIMKEKAILEDQEQQIRDDILRMMQADRRKLVSNDFLQITLKPASKRIKLDSAMVEKKFPDVFEECATTSKVKAYIVCKIKKGALII